MQDTILYWCFYRLQSEIFLREGWTAGQISRDFDQALLRLGHHLRPTNRHQSRNKGSAGQQRPYEEDEAKRDQHHSCPSCHQLPVVLGSRPGQKPRPEPPEARRRPPCLCRAKIRQKHLYVDRVWCGVVGGEPIDCGLGSDGCRGHGRRGRGHGSFVDHLGRRCCRLRRVRRCGAQQLIPRIQNRPVTQRDLVLLGSDDWPLRDITINRLVHRMSRFGGLEPAFAVTIEMIEPVLAQHRRVAGLQHARLAGAGTGAAASLGAGLNKSVKGFENAGNVERPAKSRKAATRERRWPDMENPVLRPQPGTTFERDLGRNATSIRQAREFIRAAAVPRERLARVLRDRCGRRRLGPRHTS